MWKEHLLNPETMRSVHFVSKTAEEYAEEYAEQIRKWENDPPASPCLLATSYQNGLNGFQWGRGYGRTVLECNLGNMEEWND